MDNRKSKTDGFIMQIFNVMELFVEMIKNSVSFWLYVLKGLGFFTVFPAFESLSLVSLDVYREERVKTFKNFNKKYSNSMKKRFQSILTFSFFLYSTLFIFLPLSQAASPIFFVLKYILLVSHVGMYLILLSRPIFQKELKNVKWKLPIHIYLLLKETKWTFVMIVAIIGLYYLSYKNFIFFIFVFPGLSGWIVALGTSKINKKINSKIKK